MDLVRKLWDARKLVLVVFIPLSLLPLPLIYPTSEACCAYVLIVTAIYWVSEAVPLGAAALVPAFLYPLFGVLKSSEVAAEYCKDTTLLLMGVICLAASIEKWNLHKRIALRMVMIAGAKPGMLVLGFMCCTVFLSMWLSNTSTTAMVMPIAEAVLQQLIGTGLADAHLDSEETGDAPDNESVSLSLSLSLPRFTSLSLSPSLSLPLSNSLSMSLSQVPVDMPVVKRVRARRDSQYPTKRDHMICKCLSLSITYSATIGGLITITGTSTNLIFAEQFNTLPCPALPLSSLSLCLFVSLSLFLTLSPFPCNIQCKCFLSLSLCLSVSPSVSLSLCLSLSVSPSLSVSLPLCLSLSVSLSVSLSLSLCLSVCLSLSPSLSLCLSLPLSLSLPLKGYRTDATVSVLLGFLLFLIPARRPFSSSSSWRNRDDVDPDPLAPMITWKDFQKLMPWEIVILVGGGYALAAGCKVSGLSVWIGRQLEPMSGLPPWAVTLLACLLVSAVTEFASNPATLTVFLPILSALSETLMINPLHTLIPATMCVSFGVMLPVGNPPNAIVFSYGHVKISDMVKAGFGVNLIGVAVVMLAISTWGVPLFHLTEFPAWALARNATLQSL
ncbi:unnamed protein product [Lota lota]